MNMMVNRSLNIDHYLSKKFAICADPLTPHQKLRLTFRVLELSFHGVPWLFYAVGAILWSEKAYQSTFSVNLLIGKFDLSNLCSSS